MKTIFSSFYLTLTPRPQESVFFLTNKKFGFHAPIYRHQNGKWLLHGRHRSCTFANNEIANNSSMSCCKIMMHLTCIFSKASTRTSCLDILTQKGNDGQVGNLSAYAMGYILSVEKTGSEFVLPISSPGLPKNGG